MAKKYTSGAYTPSQGNPEGGGLVNSAGAYWQNMWSDLTARFSPRALLNEVVDGVVDGLLGTNSTYLRTYTSNGFLRLTADAFIIIDGKVIGSAPPMSKIKYNEYISGISINTSTDTGAGTASVTFVVPFYMRSRFFWQGNPVIQELSEIEIYMRGRYMMNGTYAYYKSFWGLITGVNFSDNGRTVSFSIDAKDILHWWERSIFVNNPTTMDAAKFGVTSVNHGASAILDMNNPYQGIYLCARSSLANINTVTNIFSQTIGTQGDESERNSILNIVNYWQERSIKIRGKLRMFGCYGDPILWKSSDTVVENSGQDDERKFNPDITLSVVTDKGNGFQTIPLNEYTFSDDLGIANNITNLMRKDIMKTPELQVSETRPVIDIAKEIAQMVNYELYMHPAGYIMFKPPFYNMDVKDVKFGNNSVLVITQQDLISINHQRDISNIYSEITVNGVLGNKGNYTNALEMDHAIMGIYRDYTLVKKYGLRTLSVKIPFIQSNQQAFAYAQSYMTEVNMRAFTVSITILGRPEIAPGFPVYVVSEDSYFYVNTVSHSYAPGEAFKTTLSCCAGRPRFLTLKNKDIEINGTQEVKVARGAYWEWVEPKGVSGDFIGPPPPEGYIAENSDDNALQNRANLLSVAKFDSLMNTAYEGDLSVNKDGRWRLMVWNGDEMGRGFVEVDPSSSFGETVALLHRGEDGISYETFDLPQVSITSPSASNTIVPITDGNGYMLIGYMPYGRGMYYDGNSRSFLLRNEVQLPSDGDADFIGPLELPLPGDDGFIGPTWNMVVTSLGVSDMLSPPVSENNDVGRERMGTPSGVAVYNTTGSNTPMIYGYGSESESNNSLMPSFFTDTTNLGLGNSSSASYNTYTINAAYGNLADNQDLGTMSGLNIPRSVLLSYSDMSVSGLVTDNLADIPGTSTSIEDMLNFIPDYETGEWGDSQMFIQQFYNPVYNFSNDYNDDTFVDVVGDRGTRLALPNMYELAESVFGLFGR